jgi:hypothetical protein
MHIGVFVMDEKEIVVVISQITLELLADRLRTFELVMPTSCASPFAWVNRDTTGFI